MTKHDETPPTTGVLKRRRTRPRVQAPPITAPAVGVLRTSTRVDEEDYQAMTREEREVFCRIIAGMLLADGEFVGFERRFFSELLARLDVTLDIDALIDSGDLNDAQLTQDVELLRKRGHADALLRALRAAAMADGHLAAAEQALIGRVRRIIQYRLGSIGQRLPLEQLSTASLSERYDIGRLLGEGGLGEVFEAVDRQTGARCVIKRIRADVARGVAPKLRAQIEDRFWREALLISSLHSPFTVRLLNAGFDINSPYMVLERIDGETLDAALARGPFSPQETLRVMRQVLDAVAEAHALGVVHRDLKPANIMVCHDDARTVKVLDFGISGVIDAFKTDFLHTITLPSQLLGTPAYMAPEQATQLDIARRETDIYALGLILCECLMGHPVFQGPRPYHILKQQLSASPPPIPDALREGPFGPIIARACSKQWWDRFGPPPELIERVEHAERTTSPEERRAINQELYRLYSPADELLSALDEVSLEGAATAPSEKAPAKGDRRRAFFDFLKRRTRR